MSPRTIGASLLALACGSAMIAAQGRGGPEWTTVASDAQRTAWVKTDPRISTATMEKPGPFGPFTFLWKLKLEYDPKAPTTLTPPVLLNNVIGFRGFKSIVFVGTASETVHAIDDDVGEPLWKYHINYSASPPPLRAGTPECPIGMTAAASRPTAISPSSIAGRGFGGRGGPSRGGVGEPGRGAMTLAMAGQLRAGGPGPARGTVPGSAAAAAANQPGGGRARGPGGGRFGGGPFVPGADAAYVIGADGFLHALNVQNGWDNMTPAPFVPPNTRVAGLIIATSESGAIAYAATIHGCGSQPDAVWAMDLSNAQKPVTAFKLEEATLAGSAGPAIAFDGIVYVATGAGAGSASDTLFGLEPKTLKRKSSVTVPHASFSSSPVVFTWKDKTAVLVAGGGKLYLFDAATLGSGPLAVSPPFGVPEFETGALASWTDGQGLRWVAAGSPRGITTFKLVDQDGKATFESGWSHEVTAPLPPLVVNGVLFAASAGTRAAPAVLHAFDAANGKELWNSGRSITTTARGSLAAGQGDVYVPGTDGTLYAFGFEIER